MISFSDNAECCSNIEYLEKSSDIKPSDRMTDEEAEAFWKAEFQRAHDEVSTDEYDTLLSEVFNRSEDELNIEFIIDDRISTILEVFSPEIWEKLSDSERSKAISEFVNALGEGLQLDDIPDTVF